MSEERYIPCQHLKPDDWVWQFHIVTEKEHFVFRFCFECAENIRTDITRLLDSQRAG